MGGDRGASNPTWKLGRCQRAGLNILTICGDSRKVDILLRIPELTVILFQKERIEENSMSDTPETSPQPRACRDRSIPARRKARQGKAERERRIVNLLNAGVSVAEIATGEGVSLKRMR
jgi:hypothetical protein